MSAAVTSYERRDRPGMWPWAAALTSGALVALALPERHLGLVAWLALVPLLLATERVPALRTSGLLGWLAGSVINLVGLSWMVDVLRRFGPMHFVWSAAAYVALCLYQGLVFALFALSVQYLRRTLHVRGRPIPLVVLAPVVMVACELPLPFVFPWNLALTQAWSLPVIQIAELGGPSAVTALLMVVNGALADALGADGARARSVGAAALIVGLALGFGQWRVADLEAQEEAVLKLRIGIVQANAGPGVDLSSRDAAAARLALLQEKSAELDARGVGLLVWSETAFPYALPASLQRDFPETRAVRIRRGFRAPLVFGAASVAASERDPSEKQQANSAFYLGRDERILGRYDKNELVAFGEAVPFDDQLPFLQGLRLGEAGQFSRGREVTSFSLDQGSRQLRVAPMICLEDIFPGFGRRVAATHPHVLVNLTNDAWFGATSEPMQHLALAVFRSVEQRVPLVRAVNNGPSGFISSTGRWTALTRGATSLDDGRPAEVAVAEVAPLEGGHTLFNACGSLFAYLCAAATILSCLRVKRSEATRHGNRLPLRAA
jgi:apolipoprotein N-acyltransferase